MRSTRQLSGYRFEQVPSTLLPQVMHLRAY
jgi:hypothetical protein